MKHIHFVIAAGALMTTFLTTTANASHRASFHEHRSNVPMVKEWPVRSASDCPVTVIRRMSRSRVELSCPRPPKRSYDFSHQHR